MTEAPLLHLNQLRVSRRVDDVALVSGISLDVRRGDTVGIVGESGSGKSLTLRAIMDILPSTLRSDGVIDRAQTRAAMIFQEPATALNPTMRVGNLVSRVWLKHHPGNTRSRARTEALALLERVGIANAGARMSAWPHELSGGMRQRVMIAAALATDPEVLLCDEPTTALDVRVQAQILDLLRDLVADRGMAMVFVSHDLAVVSSLCEQLVVMLAGNVVEQGVARSVLRSPENAYTQKLLSANLAHRLERPRPGVTIEGVSK